MEALKNQLISLGFQLRESHENYRKYTREKDSLLLLEEKVTILNADGHVVYDGKYPNDIEEIIKLVL